MRPTSLARSSSSDGKVASDLMLSTFNGVGPMAPPRITSLLKSLAKATATFGGALRYTKYNVLIRIMMRVIVGFAGGDTDTSRDYEYTDWRAVEGFAAEFAAQFHSARAA